MLPMPFMRRRGVLDMVFLDLKLGDDDGMGLIPVLLSDSPWIKIVVITAYASIETAINAIRQGAADYLPKPFTPDQVRLVTQRISRIRELEIENSALKENTRPSGPEENLISKNHSMQQVMETLKKAAASEAIILLRGESGTGKSIFARAVHNWSSRSAKPMAVVTCPAIPSNLLESELFGHVKGAFTGAVRHNPGRIAACEGGTLFLDEIGEMDIAVQAKLLRFIQDKEYERVGDSLLHKADVRIIAATNADLEMKVAKGLFREDLFYRLNVISLAIPPLRERQEDILMLATEFLIKFSHTNHKTFLGFTEEAETYLLNYRWPGNIRELRNTIERAVILTNGDKIEVRDLPGNIIPSASIPSIGDHIPLSTIEELHIRRVMASIPSLQEAADILGIDQATLWRKRKTLGI
jgi:two-component system, NtrC family, response regulator AlgB